MVGASSLLRLTIVVDSWALRVCIAAGKRFGQRDVGAAHTDVCLVIEDLPVRPIVSG
ncbi:hypothetical protein [Propionivibrio limicola]|uniref:hypothetical protein n=1 Tax=Propionivibrio limicola TaxID=167645 RepID=UPI001479812C|nr:hypothetical protein [Propionivibrio limicola]